MRRFFSTLFVIALSPLCADPISDGLKNPPYAPWFTGPLLVPTPVNTDPKHPVLEPALFSTCTYGKYDSNWQFHKGQNVWGISPQLYVEAGFTERTGMYLVIPAVLNFQGGQTSTHFQDTQLLVGYQVSTDVKGSWVPDFRVMIQETFPTGHYQKLNPAKNGIDGTGAGSFQTGPVLAFHKLFYVGAHEFALYSCFGYLFPSMVHVKGFNTYRGGFGTSGKVRPGQNFFNYISGEYSITQNWVLSFDTYFTLVRKSHFSGKTGFTADGSPNPVVLPFSLQFSIAPEIEYNFSSSSGLIGGLWFTVLGKNSSAFGSAFIAYTHTF